MNAQSRCIACAVTLALGMATVAVTPAGAMEQPETDKPLPDANASGAVPREPYQAVERALEFIVADAARWRADHGCVTCHHGAMTVWALGEAREQGYVVDPQVWEDAVSQAKSAIVPVLDRPRDPRPPPWNVVHYPALFLGVMSHNVPLLSRDETRRLASHIARHQEEDGAWLTRPPTGSGVPPTSESRETITLLALLAWEPQVLADPAEAAADRARREKAFQWLRDTKSTDTTQAIALRLLLDVRMGKTAEQLQPGIQRLLDLQNTDGGWRQVPEMTSDAYATGQTLWVLGFAGVRPDRPEIGRAVSFLVANQRDDGSWPIEFRKHPGDDSTWERDPGPLTYFGAAWATLGLARSVPPVLDPAIQQKRAIDSITVNGGRIERDVNDPDQPVTLVDIGSGIFDDGDLAVMVKKLAAFPKLKRLKIRHSRLTDAGLVHLQPFSQLEELSLEKAEITDAGLAQLKGFTQLKTLNLKDTKVTDAGVQALQQLLPNVKVEH